jgi:DNA-binding GntR family transcriptional regulator
MIKKNDKKKDEIVEVKEEVKGELAKLVGIQKVPGGYQLVTLHLQDNDVVSIERSPVDIKAVILEKLKLETSKIILQG